MAFVCLCRAGLLDVEPGTDSGTDDIRRALQELDFEDPGKLVICLEGGGIAASGLGKTPELAVVGSFIAVLGGSLSNYAYLVRKYCLEELGLPSTVSLEAVRERTPIREAALLCKLYDRLGTGMLTKLRGKFAFCIYDSMCKRALAARDASGAVSLVHGRTDDGFNFVASGEYRPPGAVEVLEIGPGRYVYGLGEEQKFCNPEEEVVKFAAEATSAAMAALKGIKLDNARTRSMDSEMHPGRRLSDSNRRRSANDHVNPRHRRAHPGGEYGQWRHSGGDGKGTTGRRSGPWAGRRSYNRSSIERDAPRRHEDVRGRGMVSPGDASRNRPEGGHSDSVHPETKETGVNTEAVLVDGEGDGGKKSEGQAYAEGEKSDAASAPDAPGGSVTDPSLVSVH